MSMRKDNRSLPPESHSHPLPPLQASSSNNENEPLLPEQPIEQLATGVREGATIPIQRPEDKESEGPETVITSILTLADTTEDEDMRLRPSIQEGVPDKHSKRFSEAKITAYTNAETTIDVNLAGARSKTTDKSQALNPIGDQEERMAINDEVPIFSRQTSHAESFLMRFSSHSEERSLMAAPSLIENKTAIEEVAESLIQWRSERDMHGEDETLVKEREENKLQPAPSLSDVHEHHAQCDDGHVQIQQGAELLVSNQTFSQSMEKLSEAETYVLSPTGKISENAHGSENQTERVPHSASNSFTDGCGNNASIDEPSKSKSDIDMEVNVIYKDGACNTHTSEDVGETDRMKTADQLQGHSETVGEEPRTHIRASVDLSYSSSGVWQKMSGFRAALWNFYDNMNG